MEREHRLLAEARAGSAWARETLETTYRPLVAGYLACLTGNARAAHALAGDVLASMERVEAGPDYHGHHSHHSRAPSLAAGLLLHATDVGIAYLRHVRALQLAGVSVAPPVAPQRRGGPAAWLQATLERFRPSSTHRDETERETRWARPTLRQTVERHAPTRPVATRRIRMARTQPLQRRGAATTRAPLQPDYRPSDRVADLSADPRDTLRRRIMRAVLADLNLDDARALALHLVAGLSHTEVAFVSGIGSQMARSSILRGLQLFSVRYDEALELLGLSPSLFDSSAGEPALVPALRDGAPTLSLRGAVSPTHHLDRRPAQRALSPTTPRPLPMARPPRAVPVRTPARPSPVGMTSVQSPAVAMPSPAARPAYVGAETLRRRDAAPMPPAHDTPNREAVRPFVVRPAPPRGVPVLSRDGTQPRIPNVPVRSPGFAPYSGFASPGR